MNSFEQGRNSGNLEQKTPLLVMPPPRRKPSRWELWRNRLFLGEFVLVCLVIGIILIVVPWTPLWTNNSLLAGYPQVRQLLEKDFVRGLVSGLGVADICLAMTELVGYREDVD